MRTFPENFYWGAATASYQVEGWNENTDWAQAAKAGRVPPAGRLADHYHRYEEDFAIAKQLGHNAHRLSVEWARIEPEEGKWDMAAVQHYREVLQALREQGIEPLVTLWHFTLPIWFAERGGFERSDSPQLFARYCAFVVRELSNVCTHFSTMNEPNVYATHGWLYGVWPPFKKFRIGWKTFGKQDGTEIQARPVASFGHWRLYRHVMRNLARAHKAAYTASKAVQPKVDISLVKHVHYFHANGNPYNWGKAWCMRQAQTHSFLRAVAKHLDSIGLNYYRTTKFGDRAQHVYSDMGWKMEPRNIYGALQMLKGYGKPIFVAEAGLADADDSDRAWYITEQVRGIAQALEAGIDVRGHLYWSLLDNYEWALGTDKRFGLVHVNYQTLERTIRPSAWVYKEIIDANGIPDTWEK